MYRFSPIKLKSTPEQKVFFSSDLHYNHEKLVTTRGYDSIEKMNTSITNSWNNHVTNNDIVILCGDTVFKDPKGDLTKYLLNNLNYNTLYILKGNHNSGIKQVFKECDYFIPENGRYASFEGDYLELIVNSQLISCFHYPISVWNHQAEAGWCIGGHSHGSFKQSRPETPNGKILDVGWDVFYRPVEFHEIRDIMVRKQIEVLDHHA